MKQFSRNPLLKNYLLFDDFYTRLNEEQILRVRSNYQYHDLHQPLLIRIEPEF